MDNDACMLVFIEQIRRHYEKRHPPTPSFLTYDAQASLACESTLAKQQERDVLTAKIEKCLAWEGMRLSQGYPPTLSIRDEHNLFKMHSSIFSTNWRVAHPEHCTQPSPGTLAKWQQMHDEICDPDPTAMLKTMKKLAKGLNNEKEEV